MSKRISDLLSLKGDIYIYLPTKQVSRMFLQNATEEGITFSDGVLPTNRHTSDLFRLYPDGHISYVGTIGRIRFKTSKDIQRINYADYCEIE